MSDPTVFIVDDDAAVRDALGLLISLNGLRSSVFATAEEFLAVVDKSARGCVLVDLQLPGMSGLQLLSALKEEHLTMPVIVLTAHGDVAMMRASLRNGAIDFLEKPVDGEVLVDVLTNALRIDLEAHRIVDEDAQAAARIGRLTRREREVLDMLVHGRQHRDIAEQLAISPRTVEVYKARMMEKLQCCSLAELVRLGSGCSDGMPPGRNAT
jgi:FixJ family two-component response regulator